MCGGSMQARGRCKIFKRHRLGTLRQYGEQSHRSLEDLHGDGRVADGGNSSVKTGRKHRGSRSEEHTTELQSLMRHEYAGCGMTKKRKTHTTRENRKGKE